MKIVCEVCGHTVPNGKYCRECGSELHPVSSSLRYSDCYPGCGGEDCPCCDIYLNHQHESYSIPDEDGPYDEYTRYAYEPIDDEEEAEEEGQTLGDVLFGITPGVIPTLKEEDE